MPEDLSSMEAIYWNAYHEKNLYAYILHVDEVAEGEEGYEAYEEFKKLKGYYEFNVVTDKVTGEKTNIPLWEEVEVDGVLMYRIPAWRTQSLNASFSYIISLLSGTAPEFTQTPINAPIESVEPTPELGE